jgi:PAS domain-containing protein
MSEQNIYIALLAVVAAEAVTLAVLVWRRKVGRRFGLRFGLLMSGIAVWSLAYAFEIAAPRLEDKLIWTGVEYVGIVSVPLFMFWFVVEYLGQSDWLTRRNLILSAIFPAATVLFNWTNGYHGLLYREVTLDTSGSFPQFDPTYGPWFWINITYAYVLMATATVLLVRAVVRYPQLYRLQAWTMLIGAFAPWVGNAIYIFKLGPMPGLDLTPFAFTITGLAMGWSLVHYRLMDIVPAARDHIIESISDAVIVVDPRNRVVDANPAAEKLLLKKDGQLIGRLLSEVMPPQRG